VAFHHHARRQGANPHAEDRQRRDAAGREAINPSKHTCATAAPVHLSRGSRRNSHPPEAADVYDVLRYADEYDRA
jgi:hypothetical protein